MFSQRSSPRYIAEAHIMLAMTRPTIARPCWGWSMANESLVSISGWYPTVKIAKSHRRSFDVTSRCSWLIRNKDLLMMLLDLQCFLKKGVKSMQLQTLRTIMILLQRFTLIILMMLTCQPSIDRKAHLWLSNILQRAQLWICSGLL